MAQAKEECLFAQLHLLECCYGDIIHQEVASIKELKVLEEEEKCQQQQSTALPTLYILVTFSLPYPDKGPKMLSLFANLSCSPSTSTPGLGVPFRSFN